MADHYLEFKVPPLAVLLVASLLMFALTTVLPALTVSFPEKNLLAAVVAMVGVSTCIAGSRRIQAREDDGKSDARSDGDVTGDERRLSDVTQPMHLGFLLLLLAALAIYLANAASILVLPRFVFYMNRRLCRVPDCAASKCARTVFR